MALKHVLYVLNDERFFDIKGPSRLLLVALAACASDRGNVCWPSETWLMKATRISRATLYRAKTPLRDLIEIDPPGYKRSNSYYFPPVDVRGRRLTEVAKVLAAKREQEREAKGEIAATYDGGKVINNAVVDKSQGETLRSKMTLNVSQNETVTVSPMRRVPVSPVRPEIISDSEKKSFFANESQSETSQAETVVNSYDGSKRPTCREHYDWIVRHCLVAGMDDHHVKVFLAKHRHYRWAAVGDGVNVCDLIADYVTLWKEKSPDEFAYIQQLKAEDRRLAEEEKQRARVAAENAVSAYAVKNR